ncbi:hypothetical protein G7Y89_g1091 [Cudoniella acicularis]|uniref:DDHD domain-containing protein n=1 Tax=Cudoniella acicularis TaxID=354080 RepID=A0A8H4RVY8_9HELO|nr:hypothetical protein G7Y89_g1091 [Cudoniella acicularis]
MCGEGDVTGLVELLNAIEEDRDEEDMTPAELVRYQDPLDNMKTGLHVAVEKNQQEVVWLLLWLASRIETHIFPGEVVHAAEELGATRETVEGVDIRSIRDERHQTAEDIARGMGNAALPDIGRCVSKRYFLTSLLARSGDFLSPYQKVVLSSEMPQPPSTSDPHITNRSSSFVKVPQLVGQLGSDGIASLEVDPSFTPSRSGAPRSLKAAIDAVANNRRGSFTDTASESASEEDYDSLTQDPTVIANGGRGGSFIRELNGNPPINSDLKSYADIKASSLKSRPDPPRLKSIPVTLNKLKEKGRYILTADDATLREILRAGLERNAASADSPFHGFFTLFWLGTAIYMLQIAASNWQKHGNPLGSNEIMGLMFHRDVMVLGLSDGVMCAATYFGVVLQKLILYGTISWNRQGWIIQSIWEALFLVAVLGWTLFREWPWTHTVFFVLHGLVMLMKQHSYAFYNGHLSEAYKMRATLQRKLKQLDSIETVKTPSAATPKVSSLSTSYLEHRPATSDLNQRRQSLRSSSIDGEASDIGKVAAAIESGEPLDTDQVQAFERIITWEIDALSEELKGKCTTSGNHYPKNLTVANHFEYVVLPTLVYELEYPRSDKINWYYVAEKGVAVVGILGIMNLVSQTFIYPVVVRTIEMKDAGMSIQERLKVFPWILSDLIFPFMMEYMMTWYVIWECILNLLAEITYFADRGFYDDWWNSVSWDQFARDWVKDKRTREPLSSASAPLSGDISGTCGRIPSPDFQLATPKYSPATLAAYLKNLAHHAKNRYLPESLSLFKPPFSTNWPKPKGVAGRLDRQAQIENMDTAPDSRSEKPEKSYLTAAVESISPWGGSRSSTPKPSPSPTVDPGKASGLKNQHGGDHTTQHWYGLSLKDYPGDCPPLNARWFNAVDVPKRKPHLLNNSVDETKPAPVPKKFVAFSSHDSRAIEAAYQKLADEYHDTSGETRRRGGDNYNGAKSTGRHSNASLNSTSQDESAGTKVPVHEDYLFDVHIEQRELVPAYWLGPIFQVVRGTWFYDDGKPCDENLASQLEQGYIKVKPFRYPLAPEKSSSRPASLKPGEEPKSLAASGAFGRNRAGSGEVTPRSSMENLKNQSPDDAAEPSREASPSQPPKTYRLFGTYMNSIVTYQDSSIAWLSVDSIMSRMSSTVYSKFAGGGYVGGVKLVRGYSEARKARDAATAEKGSSTPLTATASPLAGPPGLQPDERQQRLLKRRSAPPSTTISPEDPRLRAVRESAEATVSLLKDGMDLEAEAESNRKRDESEIQNDYNDRDGELQSREIDHLILVTHGIGQRLSMRTESVNFIHDVSVLRQNLKNVYAGSADLQALNSEIDKLPKNCRVQVLPICWRHLLEFPKKRQIRKEHDLGDTEAFEDEYPSLEDITIEGVPFVRSLITDLALDILLYQSAYREHIVVSVLGEANRIYNLYRERHPDFKGKVSLMGHSLGSAILFDLLCRQKETRKCSPSHQKRNRHRSSGAANPQSGHLDFEFDVEDFYCIGSPIGLFQMLKGRNILARHDRDAIPAESPLDPEHLQDPFLGAASTSSFANGDNLSTVTGLPLTVSSPKVSQLYNIFHPSDPIAYRLEPLISPAMSSMKPQLLPYTKKTISASVSGIGAKVGQSFSGLWSSLSSGIASSILNRSLGLTSDDVARMEAGPQNRSPSQSIGAGTNISAGGVISPPPLQREDTNEKKRQLAEETAAADRDGNGANAPTLITDEIETLYAGFQKSRKSRYADADSEQEWSEAEERGKKLKREEMKVRALNSNGRVDYSIQESVLDFNPINTIASHLSYWGDEDVSHFVMSQLLSRYRPLTQSNEASNK